MAAFFRAFEKAAVVPHLIQQVVFHKGQKIFLDHFQISLAVKIIDLWKDLEDIGVIFMDRVAVADASVVVCRKSKGKYAVFIRRQLMAKISQPDFFFAVSAYFRKPMEQIQILLGNTQKDADFNILPLLIKIFRRDGIFSPNRAKGVKDGGFSYAVFSYQDQSVFYIVYFQVVNELKMFNVYTFDSHRTPPFAMILSGYSSYRKLTHLYPALLIRIGMHQGICLYKQNVRIRTIL